MTEEAGTLAIGEFHPAAVSAMQYVKEFIKYDLRRAMIMREALASCSLSGNRLAEICHETLRRIMDGENVSDRYLLGLAWYLREMKEETE